ncbi:hypothetical protein L9F63_025750, partial [Diploptera punctata]
MVHQGRVVLQWSNISFGRYNPAVTWKHPGALFEFKILLSVDITGCVFIEQPLFSHSVNEAGKGTDFVFLLHYSSVNFIFSCISFNSVNTTFSIEFSLCSLIVWNFILCI